MAKASDGVEVMQGSIFDRVVGKKVAIRLAWGRESGYIVKEVDPILQWMLVKQGDRETFLPFREIKGIDVE